MKKKIKSNIDKNYYWYTAKHTFDLQSLIKELKFLDSFNNKNNNKEFEEMWNEWFDAIDRYRKLVILKYLGFLESTQKYKDPIKTESFQYVKSKNFQKSAILKQMMKLCLNLEIDNKNKADYSIRIFIFPALIKLLLNLDSITFTELKIFLMRTKHFSDINFTITQIENFRKLDALEKQSLINEHNSNRSFKDIRVHIFYEQFVDFLDIKKNKEIKIKENLRRNMTDFMEKFEKTKWSQVENLTSEEIFRFMYSDNFFYNSLYDDLFLESDDLTSYVTIKIKPENLQETLSKYNNFFTRLSSSKPKIKTKEQAIKENKVRKETGDEGEKIVFNHLSLDKEKKVFWSALENENLGYDIEYLDLKLNKKNYVEVKSIANLNINSFYAQFTINELEFMKKNIENYYIYYVSTKNKKINIIKPDINFYETIKKMPILFSVNNLKL